MRIGLFTDSYPPFINGVSTSVETLKNALEEKGHIVYVVTVGQDATTYSYDEEKRILKVPGLPLGIYDYRAASKGLGIGCNTFSYRIVYGNIC